MQISFDSSFWSVYYGYIWQQHNHSNIETVFPLTLFHSAPFLIPSPPVYISFSLGTYTAWIPDTKSNEWFVMSVRGKRQQSQVESCEYESHDILAALRIPVSLESWQGD